MGTQTPGKPAETVGRTPRTGVLRTAPPRGGGGMPAPRPCCGWSARADGAYYEIDLTDDNVDALRETFSDYIAAARKANGRSVRTTAGSAPKRGNSEELAKIRDWANANGHEVSSRGRISQAVRDAYDAAH